MNHIQFSDSELDDLHDFYKTQLTNAQAKALELRNLLKRIEDASTAPTGRKSTSVGVIRRRSGRKAKEVVSFLTPPKLRIRKAKPVLTVETQAPKKRGPKPKVSAVETTPKRRPGRPPAIKTEVIQKVNAEAVARKKTVKAKPAIRKTRKTAKETPGKPALAQVVAPIKAANPVRKAVKREKKPILTSKPVSRRRLKQYGGVRKIAPTINEDYVNSLLQEPIEKTDDSTETTPSGVHGLV